MIRRRESRRSKSCSALGSIGRHSYCALGSTCRSLREGSVRPHEDIGRPSLLLLRTIGRGHRAERSAPISGWLLHYR